MTRPADRRGPLAALLAGAVRAYQLGVSRYTPPTCRFYPTCSQYGIEALQTHGPAKGILLAAWRVLRCNPWSRGGTDFVPAPGLWSNPSVLPDPRPLPES
jgi:uncharacterized protein